jgi:hypothetical protein
MFIVQEKQKMVEKSHKAHAWNHLSFFLELQLLQAATRFNKLSLSPPFDKGFTWSTVASLPTKTLLQ